MTSVKSCLILAEMDMGNWVYVLFAVVYVIVQLFSNKNKGGDEEETPEAQAAAEERRRQIQAEIQRRIQEGVGRPREQAPQPNTNEGDRDLGRVTPPVLTQANESPVQPRPSARTTSDLNRRVENRRMKPASGGMEAIEAQLRKQAERLKTAKQARANALQKAERVTSKALAGTRKRMDLEVSSGDVRASVIGSLRHRKTLKAAIILNEVMGTPMGLREEIGPLRS